MTERFDLAIVGGGLLGASLAWGMRELGRRLVLLDAGDPHTASQGTFGLVWVQGKGLGLPAYVDWTLRAAHAWPRLARELADETGIDAALEQAGGVHPCLSQDELDARAAHLDRLSAQAGVARQDVQMLTRTELLARLPMLGPEVAGGSFCPLDGHCNPLRLLAALHAALDRAGVVRRANHHVDAIEAARSGFRLHAVRGEIGAERIVIAAGRGGPRLAAMVGVRLPLVPDTGQLLVFERMQRFLPLPMETIRQTDEGAVLVGDSHEPRTGAALDLPALGAIARRAQRLVPALSAMRVVRAWAAPRVLTPDGFPVYAQSADHPGAFVVAAHSGVTLAPVHAFEVAPALRAGALPPSLVPFATARLTHVHAAA